MALSISRIFVCIPLLASLSIIGAAQVADDQLISEGKEFDKKLVSTLRSGDAKTLEPMIADGFIFIHSTGPKETKETYIKNAAAGRLMVQGTDIEVVEETWRAYAGTTVIRYAQGILRNASTGAENRLRSIEVYVKRAGAWQWVSGQSTKLPNRPIASTIDRAKLKNYVGTYAIGAGRTFVVSLENEKLNGIVTGRSPAELVPSGENTFVLFNPDNDFGYIETIFSGDPSGKATEVAMRQNGRQLWVAKRSEKP